MQIQEFVNRFEAGVRVAVVWERLLALGVPVETVTLDSRDHLGGLGLPWYLDSTGESCNFDADDARRLYVGEASTLLDGPLGYRADSVEEVAQRLEGTRSVALPAYSRNGRPILLDGCHRSLALMRAVALPRIELCSIIGPDDPTLFWDLAVPDRR